MITLLQLSRSFAYMRIVISWMGSFREARISMEFLAVAEYKYMHMGVLAFG